MDLIQQLLDYKPVEEEHHDHGDQVAEEEAEQDVALAVPVILQVVIRAGEEHALSGVSGDCKSIAINVNVTEGPTTYPPQTPTRGGREMPMA